MRFLAAALGLALATSSASAFADDSSVTHTPIAKDWYGWQVLLADGATVATTAMMAQGSGDIAAYNFIGGYALAAPLIHAGHRNYAGAIGSLATRFALPFIGAYAGCALDTPEHYEDTCLGGAASGALLGLAAATMIDATAFSWAEPKPAPKPFEVVPTAAVDFAGARIGLQGVF